MLGLCNQMDLVTPYLVSYGKAISVEDVIKRLGVYGKYGALEPIEGGSVARRTRRESGFFS